MALFELVARALAPRGAFVQIDQRGENLIRRRREHDRVDVDFVVESQGVGNLMHELVHALRVGRLDDDHGIDYRQMPFDLDRAEHQRLLWDELSACVVSCAYLVEADQPTIDAWFAEQVETQPVFYGYDNDPEGFACALEGLLQNADLAAQLRETVGAAYAEVEQSLGAVGSTPEQARPARRLAFAPLWTRYRSAAPKRAKTAPIAYP